MNSQLFFILNLVFGVMLVAWFLSSRKDGGAPPTRLNLRKGQPPPELPGGARPSDEKTPSRRPAQPPVSEQEAEAWGVFDGAASAPPSRPVPPPPGSRGRGTIPPLSPTSEVSGRQTKNLNVLFMYNGHDWDAYEVLGAPAGASLPLVTARYQELIRGAEKGQLEFFEAAYQAILKKS